MKQIIFERLFDSFDELEKAIVSARNSLTKQNNNSPELLQRIETYEEILSKQRSLAQSLSRFLRQGNWNEVSRHIQLINGLSLMIRDDAREILDHLQCHNQPSVPAEITYS